jgi:hypothetical protein
MDHSLRMDVRNQVPALMVGYGLVSLFRVFFVMNDWAVELWVKRQWEACGATVNYVWWVIYLRRLRLADRANPP